MALAGAVKGVKLPRTKLPGTCLCRAALPPSRRNSSAASVLRLKIRLLEVSPMIWRRVLVLASYTLEELHGVIQVSMGWQSLHLYYSVHKYFRIVY
jgi:Plasmid pRiA4b ORF-3-like protein